jgi:flagellar FliJ protein
MYRFNLESLLNHRRYQEEILQKELAHLKTLLAAEKQKLRVTKKKKRKYLRQLRQKQKGSRPVSEIKLYLDFVDRLSKDLAAQNHRVVKADRRFNQKRQDLIVALKRRKMLDKLKEKGRQAHQQKILKKERDFMDEVSTHQFILKK